jgi:hypothetical protein
MNIVNDEPMVMNGSSDMEADACKTDCQCVQACLILFRLLSLNQILLMLQNSETYNSLFNKAKQLIVGT